MAASTSYSDVREIDLTKENITVVFEDGVGVSVKWPPLKPLLKGVAFYDYAILEARKAKALARAIG